MEQEKIYQIFVSSTYEDLKEERQAAMTAIIKSGNMPIGMEYFPSADYTIFDYIKKMINQADYYFLIIGGKYGSIDSSTGKSFTQMEYEYAKSLNIPIIVFPRKDIEKNIPAEKIEIDTTKRELLNNFRKEAMGRMSAGMWNTPAELGAAISTSIPQIIKDTPRIGWVRADSTDIEPDDFDYSQIAYTTHIDDPTFWEIDHDGETFTPQDITWKDIVVNVFPKINSMLSSRDIWGLIKNRCGEIRDTDFDSILLQMQKQQLIKSEVISYYEGGGEILYHLTSKGIAAMFRLTE
ncbi:MAG: DUF4062 domain-containing protein [Paludibacteraceae bacterium]|nr:DUF4062 domain-containing protein [Paludibacteraceae bacterium]